MAGEEDEWLIPSVTDVGPRPVQHSGRVSSEMTVTAPIAGGNWALRRVKGQDLWTASPPSDSGPVLHSYVEGGLSVELV